MKNKRKISQPTIELYFTFVYNKIMNSEIKQILNKIEKNGFEAYVVGGFVRDYLLCRKSIDIDICTNALPKDIKTMFQNASFNEYGSFNIKAKHYNFDITTYRKEFDYVNRCPSKIEYTNNLLEDLQRRDFTMNAICMNTKGNIINLMNGVEDLEQKQICMIGNPEQKLKEDPLRILRAIRFSCTHNLMIENNLYQAMRKNVHLVTSLSKSRIKRELDTILLSTDFEKGLTLLKELGILSLLDMHYGQINYVNDVCGMWAQLKNIEDLPFTKNETKQISQIRKLLSKDDITPIEIFEFGLYTTMVVAKIKKIPEDTITKMYKKLPIENRKDLKISFQEITKMIKKEPQEVKKIETRLIHLVLTRKIKNKRDALIKELEKEGLQ